MAEFSSPPIDPVVLRFTVDQPAFTPAGPQLVRRLSDLAGVFADAEQWRAAMADDDPVVYSVTSSPVPETPGELPQSITTIAPGDIGGELFVTKGHLHTDPQGEIYLGLAGSGGLLLFDGTEARFLPVSVGDIGYIPPYWAHRSVNVGTTPYTFLAVYPGSAGHDYQWVLDHGMGHRVYREDQPVPGRAADAADQDGPGYRLEPYSLPADERR